jgi:hypothetical protein
MKREPKNYKIKKIHPRFFWKRCCICNKEVKKEDIWKANYSEHSIPYYICTECAETKEQAERYVKAGYSIPIIVPPLKSPGKPPKQPQTRVVEKS